MEGEKLGDALGRYLKTSGLAAFLTNDELKACWEQAVGEQILPHTRLMGIQKQVLRVEVDSSPRLHELQCFLKAQIVEHFQRSYSRVFIKDISFTLGSF